MSVQDELLIPRINRKQLFSILIIAGILISVFSFSNLILNLLLENQRTNPSDELANAIEDEIEPTLMIPPLPWDLDELLALFDFDEDMQQLLEQLGITEQDLINVLQSLMDGEVDSLNAVLFGAVIVALLASEVEVFRLLDYDDASTINDNLWRYECYDVFEGGGWSSTSVKDIGNFYSYSDYEDKYSDQDLLIIKMNMIPDEGINSFMAPHLFPSPNLMEDSVYSRNINGDLTSIFKDTLNCTSLDTYFESAENSTIYYELFGQPIPTNEQINSSALDEFFTPSAVKTKYLQLPPTVDYYIQNNPNFKKHYDALDALISDTDQAFAVANKIRNYLQENFDYGVQQRITNGPEDGDDVVEWFLGSGEGISTDFASAFCAFCRAFGVASRFVDGYNSRFVQEIYDEAEGKNALKIKYKNLYNWAEVYVPFDVLGHGTWVQMDVLYDSFGGGSSLTDANFTIDLTSSFSAGNRGGNTVLTATIASDEASVANRKIRFIDSTENVELGEKNTDAGGVATLIVPIDTSQVVGPHLIRAELNPQTYDTVRYVIYGDVVVNLQSVDPTIVNVSSTNNYTQVRGKVVDPLNLKTVKNGDVVFSLYRKTTDEKILNPFSPHETTTDNNGEFNQRIEVNPSVAKGEYYIKAIFNGTWSGEALAVGYVDDASDPFNFNVTADLTKFLSFYINNFPSSAPEQPVIVRGTNIQVKAVVKDENGNPRVGEIVNFYDDTRGTLIGTNTTNGIGTCTRSYNTGLSYAGPNLLHASFSGTNNYSYFLLNEKLNIKINSGPTPQVINRTGASGLTQFTIQGEVLDNVGNKIKNANITMKLLRYGFDNSTYLNPNNNDIYSGNDGSFTFSNYQVDSNTPAGNYTFKLEFNGTIDLTDDIRYPYKFVLGSTYQNATLLNKPQLKVQAPITMDLYINGTTIDNYTDPVIYRWGHLNLTVFLREDGLLPVPNERIDFYDVTNDTFIGFAITDSQGIAKFKYMTLFNTVAGPHLIYAKWGSRYNYSYYILDENLWFDLDFASPTPSTVDKAVESQRYFIIRGNLTDTTNFRFIKYAKINVKLMDGVSDYIDQISLVEGSLNLNETGEIYLKYYIGGSLPVKNYNVWLNFTGTFNYTSPNNDNNPYLFELYPMFNIQQMLMSQLQVTDTDNIEIRFRINGTDSQPSYSDSGAKPRTFKSWNNITFELDCKVGGSPVFQNYNATIWDLYTNKKIIEHNFTFVENGNKFWEFKIADLGFHDGLHYLKVTFEQNSPHKLYSTYNFTYIVINQSINILGSIQDKDYSITVNTEGFVVSGSLRANGTALRGLKIKIQLLDKDYKDSSAKLIVVGSKTITINNDGTFSFTITEISTVPRGLYYILLNFTGSISATGISLTNYMVTNSTMLFINVTHVAQIVNAGYYTDAFPSGWYLGDTCHVVGNLTWSNGTGLYSMLDYYYVNITIKSGSTIINQTSVKTIDAYGRFSISFEVKETWLDPITIYVSFYPLYSKNFGDSSGYFVEGVNNQQLSRL